MRRVHWILSLAGLAMLAGCWDTTETITLNPDGSGKCQFLTVTALPINPMGGSQDVTDPEEAAKTGAANLLKGAKGVDAWKDVSWRVLDDGRIEVKATAYFKDLAELELPVGPMRAQWKKNDDGTGTLTMKVETEQKRPGAGEEEKPEARPDLAGEDLKKAILIQKMKYRQGRPMLVGMFESLKMDATYKLPGKAKSIGSFSEAPGGVKVNLNGKKFIEALDKLAMDDALLAQAVKAGGEAMNQEAFRKKTFEALFGKAEMLEATVTDLKPQFDYTAEVAEAKKAEPALREKLGLPAGGGAPMEGGGEEF